MATRLTTDQRIAVAAMATALVAAHQYSDAESGRYGAWNSWFQYLKGAVALDAI